VLYLKTDNYEKYLYSGDLATLTAENLENFLKEIKEGTIKPHAKE